MRGSRSLLSRRDWVYLLSLLIPLVVYALVLKGLLVFAGPADAASVEALALVPTPLPPPAVPALAAGLRLMPSDLLFTLAYGLLWVTLFAVARPRPFRWLVVVLFHVLTILVALITTTAYQYFTMTGSTLDAATLLVGLSSLDADTLLLGLASPGEMGGLIASGFTVGILVLTLVILVYAIFGPPVVAHVVGRRRGWSAPDAWEAPRAGRRWPRVLALGCLASGLFAFSLLPGGGATGASTSFARAAVVQVVMTAVAQGEERPAVASGPPAEHLPSATRLLPTAATARRNVVVIVLESTRAGATTPYNADLPTTPFMNALAQHSLLVEQAYAIVPHTHNALTATACGVDPPLDPWRTRALARPGTVPATCLPHLLRAQGYNTVYFMSQGKSFENSQRIMGQLGYEDFYSVERMDTAGFAPTNYFGYEDEVMLEPSRAWLAAHRDRPFLATYLTSAPHHDYRAPHQRHGRVAFTTNDLANRYLNSVRNQDFFLEQLFAQYQRLGLYRETVFLILGDHGEGFGEHGRFQHDNTIYEEGLRIPLLIHDPTRFAHGARLAGPATQVDILPTVADLLGYAIQGGAYGGHSLLRPLPHDRTLRFSCWGERRCLAGLQGREKYIYHFGDRPEELFDLATDPAERQNLAGQRSADELNRRRSELLAWRARVQARYGTRPADE